MQNALQADGLPTIDARPDNELATVTNGGIAPLAATPPAPWSPGSTQQTTNVNVNVGMPNIQFNAINQGPSFVVRALWFVCVGWWLSALFILTGYLLALTVVLLPLGLWFLNRVPQAQTLRARTREFTTEFRGNAIVFTEGHKKQIAWYLRLLYLPAGLVLGLIWLTLAWLVSLTIIGIPISIMMIDRAATVITLEQN